MNGSKPKRLKEASVPPALDCRLSSAFSGDELPPRRSSVGLRFLNGTNPRPLAWKWGLLSKLYSVKVVVV